MTQRLSALMTHLARPEDPPPWSLLTALNGVIVAFVAILVGILAANAWLGEGQLTNVVGWTAAGVLTLVYLFSTHRKPDHRAALRLNPPALPLFFVLLLSLGMAILLDIISLAVTREFLPAPELLSASAQTASVGVWIGALVLMALAQPVAEELVFRGVVFPAVRTAAGAWGGLIANAAVYALFHWLAYSSLSASFAVLWYTLLLPFLAGLYFAGVRAYTGSTRAAVVAHVAFGLFAVLKAFALLG